MWPRISPKDRAAGSGLKAYSPSGIFSAALVIQDVTCVWTHLRIAAHRLQVRSLRHRSTGQDKQYRKKFHRQIVARKADCLRADDELFFPYRIGEELPTTRWESAEREARRQEFGSLYAPASNG